MCTALSFKTNDHYFGRTLDLEYSYHETVTITPRNFPFVFRCLPSFQTHFALIGMAYVRDNYPLYYDATNERGLSIAGLNFPGNAVYYSPQSGKENVASFELIPWILGQCETIAQVKNKLLDINIVDLDFSAQLPKSPLHWIISDQNSSIVVECMKDGMHIYDNPIGVMTNNPPFDFHLTNLAHYMNLTREEPVNRFAPQLSIQPFGRGMGAIGLPGDLSSASRFVRAAFVRENSVCDDDEDSSISQFFHILGAVEQQRGCVRVGNDFEITVYTSCCNTTRGIYYYSTYGNRQLSAIDMHHVNLDKKQLINYPLITKQQIKRQN